jgi:hypothetical protein
MKGLQHANAFVIQFRGTDEGDAGRFTGRVEHVASGRTVLFQSVEDLPDILLKVLRDLASEKGNEIRSGCVR